MLHKNEPFTKTMSKMSDFFSILLTIKCINIYTDVMSLCVSGPFCLYGGHNGIYYNKFITLSEPILDTSLFFDSSVIVL